MGDNAASNAPRMLTWLAEAERRGAQLVHINPLIEAASRRTIVPHEFVDMATFHTTADRHDERPGAHRRRPGAAARRRQGGARGGRDRPGRARPGLHRRSTRTGSTTTARSSRRRRGPTSCGTPASPRRTSGTLADSYMRVAARHHRLVPRPHPARARRRHGPRDRQPAAAARQHRPRGRRAVRRSAGTATCRATGPAASTTARARRSSTGSPRRAASTRRASTAWARCATIEAMHRGDVKVFVALGGNFALAAPDRRVHLRGAAQLRPDRAGEHQAQPQPPRPRQAGADPALPRPHREGPQASGEQGVTVEDSMSMVHISYGMKEPASPQLRSECAILAGMAQATLPDSKTPWQDYVDDYDRIRDTMARALDGLRGLQRAGSGSPHGFRIAQPARERVFHTPSGRAEFWSGAAAGRRRPGRGPAHADHDPLARPVQHHDLLQRRPLPRPARDCAPSSS